MADPYTNKISIPDRHQEFCKAVAKLAREHNLYRFSGSFRPSYDDAWREQIEFSWEQGRHGEDSDRISMWSTLRINTHIGPEKQQYR